MAATRDRIPRLGALGNGGSIRKSACCTASIAVINGDDLPGHSDTLDTECVECGQVNPRQVEVDVDDLT